MRTSLLLVVLALGAESAAAQTPVPVPPRTPPPAGKPPVAAPPAKPLLPATPWEPLLSLTPPAPLPDWHFSMTPPSLERFHEPFVSIHPEPLLDWHTPMAPPPPHFSEPFVHLETWPDPGAGGSLSRLRPEQGSPEDSLFRAAREALNRGEYSRATTLFASFEQRFPRSRVAPSAMYYRAFALYRSGSSDDLRAAVAALKTQQERYPEAATDPDAATLRTRVYAALAARGDAQAASALRNESAKAPTCDKEDMDVRAEALNALAQLEAPEARPTLKRVLARRDECSVTLRRRAVYILGRSGTEETAADLLDAAKNDPDAGVRSDAIMLIARAPGANTVKVLEQLFNESTDEKTKHAALSALRAKGGPEAKRVIRSYIEKADLTDRVRAEAIQQLGRGEGSEYYYTVSGQRMTAVRPTAENEEDATFLKGLYAKSESRTVKSAIISTVARIGGPANEQWLLGIAKNKDEESPLRREALSRIKTSALTIEALVGLFDALPERELRYAVVSQLGNRDDPAAVDKLIEIVKSSTDPQVRRHALNILSQKKDPRTTKLLLELVEKP